MKHDNVTSRVEYAFAFSIEKNFDISEALETSTVLYTIACFCALAYLLLVYVGQVYMKNRPAYDLRPALVLWNTALAMFSIWGSLRVLPELFHVLKHFGLRYSVCVDNMEVGNPVTMCWYYVFFLSKFFDLGDTAFLVLRKKKLIFLHWFHHSSSLVFTLLLFDHRAVIGRWFGCMNLTVHSFMYSYYALRAAGFRLPLGISLCVTAVQIAQMIAGFFISLRVYLIWLLDERTCSVTALSANLSVVLYSILLILFLNFFRKKYFNQGSVAKRE